MSSSKDTNYRYWLSNTLKATQAHSSRLAEACGYTLDPDSVSAYISDIAEGKDPSRLQSPFPETIRGVLRDMPQPKHLMLRLACVHDAATGISYEFLVEYGLFESSTGIYFGIKAVSGSGISDDSFLADADKTIEILDKSAKTLFSSRRLQHCPITDNADNGTYWPLWLPSPGCNDLASEIELLYKIFRQFVRAFPEMELRYDEFRKFMSSGIADATALDDLLKKITSIFASDESAILFQRFIDNACKREILVECGNGQWRFNRHWDYNSKGKRLKMTNKAAFDLIVILFSVMAEHFGITRKRYIPWILLSEVLFDADMKPVCHRQQHPSQKVQYYRDCKNLCLELMELQ